MSLMSTEKSTLTVIEARELLGSFSCIDLKLVESADEKAMLQQALVLFKDESDHQNLGICADNSGQGFSALTTYLTGLGFEIPLERDRLPELNEPVYIKFNSQSQKFYQDVYTGEFRGVLISFLSYVNDRISGTYGYLPLDLFA
mgnify:CR=1 FL=1